MHSRTDERMKLSEISDRPPVHRRFQSASVRSNTVMRYSHEPTTSYSEHDASSDDAE